MKSVRCFALLAISVLLFAGALSAQQTTAKIFGVVQLEDGSLVPGVNVEATSPKLVGKAVTVTDENGSFRLVNLSPGTYKVIFTLQGFQTVIRDNVSLVAEQTLNLKVEIKLGNLEEAITITGQTALIDVKSTSKGMTLTKEMFDVLPKGRNFDGLVAVIPGAVNENMLGGLSIDGSSGGENMFYMDGQNTNSVFGGQNAQQAAFDFVDEVQVKASGYQAEFGGSLGGVINVVTRSGGNEFHGDVVGYYSGSALRGAERDTTILDPKISAPTMRVFNYEDRGQALTDSRLEGGFGIGGYIVKDKLWFYVNALPVFRNNKQPAIYLYPANAAHAASDPFAPTPVINTYSFTSNTNDLNFQAKLSAQPFKNLRFSLSFINNYNYFEGALPSRNGQSSDSYAFGDLGYGFPNWSTSANIDYTLGNNFMISARAGYFFLGTNNNLADSSLNVNGDPIYQMVVGNGSITAVPAAMRHGTGWTSQSFQAMTAPFEVDEQFNLSAGTDVTYFLNLAGEHAWKAGFSFTRAGVNRNQMFNAPYVRFSGWRDKTATTTFRVTVDVRGGVVGQPGGSRTNPFFSNTGQYGAFGDVKSNRMAVYLQDSWTIANKLTLNFGVRLEKENVPSFNDDPAWSQYIGADVIKWGFFDKISPRLGFVYDVMGDSSFKIFGSYGIYNDTMELDMAQGSFGGFRWIRSLYYLSDPTRLYDIGKVKADGTRDWSMLTFRAFTDYRAQYWDGLDPDIKPMAQSEMSLGIEKKISDDLSFSARGTWRQLIRTIDDVGIVVPFEGGYNEVYNITNPGYGLSRPISQGGNMPDDYWPTPKAQRDYKALNLALDKRMSNNWMGGVNLTLSRLFGNYTGSVSADEAIAGGGNGRTDANVTRYFDFWWIGYKSNGKEETSNGLLPTDRPIVAKAYGSYAFPFGLTLGGVFNYMSGTPRTTEFYIDTAAGYYPLGRNDLGRTPSLWFVNAYAEYNLKLGKNTLQFSINIDNATNNDAATWYYTTINDRGQNFNFEFPGVSNITGGDGNGAATVAFIKAGYDLFAFETSTYPQGTDKWLRDPRYNKPILYQLPITARLGVKFIF
ncbi:MAG: TonB-dependent receptor [Candidatus Aminicenantes bacterium]|nr:TonB-dependent receptor [Candidatus Aminicenantes bacterium]